MDITPLPTSTPKCHGPDEALSQTGSSRVQRIFLSLRRATAHRSFDSTRELMCERGPRTVLLCVGGPLDGTQLEFEDGARGSLKTEMKHVHGTRWDFLAVTGAAGLAWPLGCATRAQCPGGFRLRKRRAGEQAGRLSELSQMNAPWGLGYGSIGGVYSSKERFATTFPKQMHSRRRSICAVEYTSIGE